MRHNAPANPRPAQESNLRPSGLASARGRVQSDVGWSCSSLFPVFHVARNDAKERMRLRPENPGLHSETLRIARSQLGHEVQPLVAQLTARRQTSFNWSDSRNVAWVQAESSASALGLDDMQIVSNSRHRYPGLPESRQLGVMAVPASPSLQDRLGKETLAPERNQTA